MFIFKTRFSNFDFIVVIPAFCTADKLNKPISVKIIPKSSDIRDAIHLYTFMEYLTFLEVKNIRICQPNHISPTIREAFVLGAVEKYIVFISLLTKVYTMYFGGLYYAVNYHHIFTRIQHRNQIYPKGNDFFDTVFGGQQNSFLPKFGVSVNFCLSL